MGNTVERAGKAAIIVAKMHYDGGNSRLMGDKMEQVSI